MVLKMIFRINVSNTDRVKKYLWTKVVEEFLQKELT